MDTNELTDTSELTYLELSLYETFSLPCEHSQHDIDLECHNGDAEAYIRIVHNCPAGPDEGAIYRSCKPWANYVTTMADTPWKCLDCSQVFRSGREFLEFLGWI